MTLGNRLFIARKRVGLSQEYVANQIGVHRTTIGKYENDECEPSLEVIKKLIELYNEDANYILFGNERKEINVTQLSDTLLNKIYFIISKSPK